MEDADDRWYLMHRVWVGMLCYSASMCRAYLHAKSLGEGGEGVPLLRLAPHLAPGGQDFGRKASDAGQRSRDNVLGEEPVQDRPVAPEVEPWLVD